MSLPLHGVKLRHLRIVLAVHESDNITQAASRLHVSPAAVSKALAEAEERRRQAEAAAKEPAPVEINGRGGLDPVRYGDWESKGITSDF